MTDRALSFGPAAAAYDTYRPSYPPAALEWALGAAPLRVVDLGAGTGKMTRVLLGLGHEVVPVEPDPGMRAQLDLATGAVTALAGSAEQIPLPDGSVDAVVAAQSYHWFNHELAHPEIARVLRSGGVFVAVWNIRDESTPWLEQLTRIADDVAGRRGETGKRHHIQDGLGVSFGDVQKKIFNWTSTTTKDDLVAMMATRSYYLTSPPDRRVAIEQAIRDLVADLPDPFELPYFTEVFQVRRD